MTVKIGNMLCSHDADGEDGDDGDDEDGNDYVDDGDGDVAGDHDDDVDDDDNDADEEGKRRLISIDKTGAARLSINLPPRLLFHNIFREASPFFFRKKS